MKQIYKILGIIGLFALLGVVFANNNVIELVNEYNAYYRQIPLGFLESKISSDGKYVVCIDAQVNDSLPILYEGKVYNNIKYDFLTERNICLFDSNGNLLWGYRTVVSDAGMTPDGKYISAVIGDGVYFFNNEGKLLWWHRINNSYSYTTISITPDGKYIVSGSLDKTIKLWGVLP